MNRFVRDLGLTFWIGCTVAFLLVFISAFLNGGVVTVYINRFSEMWLESIIIVVLGAFGVYYMWCVLTRECE